MFKNSSWLSKYHRRPFRFLTDIFLFILRLINVFRIFIHRALQSFTKTIDPNLINYKFISFQILGYRRNNATLFFVVFFTSSHTNHIIKKVNIEKQFQILYKFQNWMAYFKLRKNFRSEISLNCILTVDYSFSRCHT